MLESLTNLWIDLQGQLLEIVQPLIHRFGLTEFYDDVPAGLEALNSEVSRQGAMIAYTTIFAWMAAGMMLLFPIIILLRKPPQMAQAPRPTEAHAE